MPAKTYRWVGLWPEVHAQIKKLAKAQKRSMVEILADLVQREFEAQEKSQP